MGASREGIGVLDRTHTMNACRNRSGQINLAHSILLELAKDPSRQIPSQIVSEARLLAQMVIELDQHIRDTQGDVPVAWRRK